MKKDLNPSIEEDVEEMEKEERAIRETELRDLRDILNTNQGRRFVNRVFNKCFLFNSTFTGSSQTFFNEGSRNVALWLLREITILADAREVNSEVLMECFIHRFKEL